jgi:hypothetical protein
MASRWNERIAVQGGSSSGFVIIPRTPKRSFNRTENIVDKSSWSKYRRLAKLISDNDQEGTVNDAVLSRRSGGSGSRSALFGK